MSPKEAGCFTPLNQMHIRAADTGHLYENKCFSQARLGSRRVALDKVEGIVKTESACAVRLHRDLCQRG